MAGEGESEASMSRTELPSMSADCARRNPALAGATSVQVGAVTVGRPSPASKREPGAVRQLNKAETRALDKARREWPRAIIMAQALTLPLSGGDTYRPDIVILKPCDWFRGSLLRMVLVEVKGGYKGPGWEQGVERYKRAVVEYPALEFELWDMAAKEATA
jgi:hypothetical protein